MSIKIKSLCVGWESDGFAMTPLWGQVGICGVMYIVWEEGMQIPMSVARYVGEKEHGAIRT